MSITPDTTASIKFLQKWEPKGPWVLTAIDPERKGIETRTFHADETKQLREWEDNYNGKRNIYFHVNPTLRDMDKKAERQDISQVRWLHVDIDPRKGEELEGEQERAYGLLMKTLPDSVPEPTAVVFSGGGYQAFWRLTTPIEINGDIELAEKAKCYNIQLERLFGADNCHNIDRIMRLPGSINVPDERKRKKGRTKALAKVIVFNDLSYSIDQFVESREVQINDHSGFSGETINVSGNIAKLSDISEIDKHASSVVPDWCKVLIVQGCNPDDATKYESRSEALFAACCEMLRCGVDNETIYSVITDPGFLISESVLDKGSNSEKYALRQIERANEEAIDPLLRQLNEKHAVISDMGGKCMVISEVFDTALNRPNISPQSFENFRNRYMNQRVQVDTSKSGRPVYKPLGKWWLEHDARRQFETITFSPGITAKNAYNLWKGFYCEAKPGDCSLFLGHIKENICQNVDEYYDYLIGWMANTVQFPANPGQTAVVLRGRQGTGKSFFAKTFGKLWGRHFLQISNPKYLVGSFNAHMRDCVVLFGDEAFYAGDKRHEAVLKALITEECMTLEAKGVNVETVPNYSHIILASNSDWVVPSGPEERRFFVLDIGDNHQQDHEYFAKVDDQLNNGGYEALLYFLLNYDLSEYKVRVIPQTDALREQKIYSFSPEQSWWYGRLLDGSITSNKSDWEGEAKKTDIYEDYIMHAQTQGVQRRLPQIHFGRFLGRVCPGEFPVTRQRRKVREDGSMYRPKYYGFPSLEDCRGHWSGLFGGKCEWENTEPVDTEQEHYEDEGEEPF